MGENLMPEISSADKQTITEFLSDLRKRRPDTKYQLVKLLIELGANRHLLDEIKPVAVEHHVAVSNLF
jgi:hypothetical protein